MITVSVSTIRNCKFIFNLRNSFSRYALLRQKYFRNNFGKNINSLVGDNPVVMKLDTTQFQSIFTAELKALFDLFKHYGYELRIAGGAVRDLLIGQTPKDLDFATTATPTQMKEMFIKENIRIYNTNGEKHGTISARINDKENFEITTLRVDVRTDGRHADVEFTTEWKLDANRRDLTINSMFLDMNGFVYDYFNGYNDLKNKRVIFVGDPEKRIQEDYLRILRYFRFYGRIADKPNNHDCLVLEAIKNNRSGLKQISGERIWSELTKILSGHFAGELIIEMMEACLGQYFGLPENPNIVHFQEVWKKCDTIKLKPISLFSALFTNVEDVFNCNKRLKWSGYERDLAYFITDFRTNLKITENPLKLCVTYMINYSKVPNIEEYVKELIKYNGNMSLLTEFELTPIPQFPITPRALINHGLPRNKSLGHIIQLLMELWINSDFSLTQDELLSKVPNLLENLKSPEENKLKVNYFPKYKF